MYFYLLTKIYFICCLSKYLKIKTHINTLLFIVNFDVNFTFKNKKTSSIAATSLFIDY